MVFYFDAGQQRQVRDHCDFFLVNLPTFDANVGIAQPVPELNLRLAELTSYFTVFSFNLPLTELHFAPSWDAALERGHKDFCLIQNCGHLFYGYDPLSVDMMEALSQCEFLMGHIMDRGGYFYMHDQCLLVNRRTWEKLGKPKFGTPELGQKRVSMPYRSLENVHDDYTPITLDPLGKTITVPAKFGYGWNAISAGLAGEHRVLNWSKAVRRWKHNCYAYYGDTREWIRALADVAAAPETQDTQLQVMLKFLRNTPNKEGRPKGIFVFNSESDADLPTLSYRNGLDSAFVLASGFKANRILETFGFHDATEVVIYDYSAPALALRKLMADEWNGENFGAFFQQARPRIEAMFPSRVSFLPETITKDAAAVEKEFQREIGACFKSAEQWLKHWQRFKALKHTYVEVDVMHDHAKVKTMIETHGRGHSVLWFSDMFNSPNAVGKFNLERRNVAYDMIKDTLASSTDSYLIIGGAPSLWVRG